MFIKIVNPHQTTFVSLRYILDNMLLAHETIDSANKCNQSLKFAKTYIKVGQDIFSKLWTTRYD
jgi:hypothetical protein